MLKGQYTKLMIGDKGPIKKVYEGDELIWQKPEEGDHIIFGKASAPFSLFGRDITPDVTGYWEIDYPDDEIELVVDGVEELEEINFSKCHAQVNGGVKFTLCPNLTKINGLRALDWSEVTMLVGDYDEEMGVFADLGVTTIDFSGCNFSDNFQGSALLITGNPNLESINFGGCFKDSTALAFQMVVVFNQKLQELSLTSNDFNWKDSTMIGTLFAANEELKHVDLSGAKFDVDAAKGAEDNTGRECFNLEWVKVSGCSDEVCDYLAWRLGLNSAGGSNCWVRDGEYLVPFNVMIYDVLTSDGSTPTVTVDGKVRRVLYEEDNEAWIADAPDEPTSLANLFKNQKITQYDYDFDAWQVEDCHSAFEGCTELVNAYANGFGTEYTYDLHNMFKGCSKLETLMLRYWYLDPDASIDSADMFTGCDSLQSVDVEGSDEYSISFIKHALESCVAGGSALWKLNGNILIPAVVNGLIGSTTDNYYQGVAVTLNGAAQTVQRYDDLERGWIATVPATLTSCEGMLEYDTTVDYVNLGTLGSTANVTNMSNMFHNCSNLSSLDVSMLDMSNATNTSNMFYGSGVAELTVGTKDLSKVTTVEGMFRGCTNLKSLDLSNVTFSDKLTTMERFLTNLRSLESLTIDPTKWDVSNVTTLNQFMDINLTSDKLKHLDLHGLNFSKVENANAAFRGLNGLEDIDLSGWDMSNGVSTNQMFYNCSSLKTIDLSSWNLKVSLGSADSMFYGCSSLEIVDLSGWTGCEAWQGTDQSVFKGCDSLQKIHVKDWTTDAKNAIKDQLNWFNRPGGWTGWKIDGDWIVR